MAENVVDAAIKVMIVDDEQLVRQGLRMTVNWEKHQMTVVADSPNGMLGWESFLKHRPHVVITDIVMPEMDGIELARKIKADYPETKILFLSCHRDFAFAKQGIQLGISDYIVKTNFDDEQMDDFLAKIRQELVQPKKMRLVKPIQTAEQAQPQDNLLQMWLQEGKQAAAVQLRRRLENEWQWMVSGGYMFHLFITGDGSEARQDYDLMDELSQASPFLYDEHILFLRNDQHSLFLLCGQKQLEACKNELLAMKLNKPLLDWRCEETIHDPSYWFTAAQKMYRLRQIELQTELSSSTHKEDVLHAIDFIEQHLHLDIRAADLAKKIGVSRSYFSTLFKEATGCSLISFISERKVKRAKELLRLTNLRTEEVAEQVGIQDAKYFSKWFKKCVSQTPSQYRYQTK
ncbi:MAG: hypothetical protein K0S39_895 [Paenibacillus sp.]|jgi:two-component system response regulator YesN|nr:hypothetical protein [Paenibacillus sp.]